ncbi:MAG: HD domain-containing protein [Proteobacteria bacterium]|nr:HD domain-containing protein [Pseudomonadota bacterium]
MGMQQQRVNVDLRSNIDDLIKQAEPRDTHHFDHQDRVAHLACAIGGKLSLQTQTLRGLSMAAMLHDIGMVTIPKAVFDKPSELTDSEFELLKQHPETGYNMLKAVEFPWPVAQIVRQHHEHFDGTGYPHGLTDAEILDEAKILAVADTVEAITSTRPYRPAANLKEAIEEVERRSGTYYEPDVVEAFLRLVSNGELLVNGYRSQ